MTCSTRTKLQRSVLAGALAGALLPGAASAASFYIIESSPSQLGQSFAGISSFAGDTSTAYFNPAGMTRVDGRQLGAAGHLIYPYAEFNDKGSTNDFTGQPISGPEGETDESALVPNLYYVMPLGDGLKFGLAINAPFGLASSYKDNWVGRYHATDSELKTVNLNPSIAYQATDKLSIAGGISYQPIEATLESEVDSAAACVAAGDTPGSCGTKHGGFANRSSDSSSKIEGDDSAFAVNLGILYDIDASTRIGATWRQGQDYTLSGTVDFTKSQSCMNDPFCSGALQDGKVKADIQLPDIFTLGVTHAIDDAWTVSGDISWYNWSTLDQVRVERKGSGQEVSTLDLEYNDTNRYSVGVTYAPAGKWTWRGGLSLDETPISGPDTVTPRIPDGDRTWISAGFNYAVSDTASVDVGYAHLFVDQARIDNSEQGNTLRGKFDPTVDIFGVQGNWRF